MGLRGYRPPAVSNKPLPRRESICTDFETSVPLIPRKRKAIIDFDRLTGLFGFDTYEQLKNAHFKWMDSVIQDENNDREAKWSQSIAVGSEAYIKKIKEALGFRARGRKIHQIGDSFELRETMTPYRAADSYEVDNTLLWDQRR